MNPRKIKRSFIYFLAFIILGLLFFIRSDQLSANNGDVYLIELDDATINPVTTDYILNSIDLASDEGAECLILKLDTPGGLLTSTRIIVKKILGADIPVVVYIAPGGARAGSAGVFITYASHVAAMAPSTNIGAAHPVQLGGGRPGRSRWEGLRDLFQKPDQEDQDNDLQEQAKDETQEIEAEEDQETQQPLDEDPMNSKVLNDTVAFIKAIAKERNRNTEWAVSSVTESDSITAKEALEKGVVEIIAQNEQDLLEELDGRVLKMKNREITLSTKGASIQTIPMNLRERILNVLANPNIAYIFMILGFYGLLYEVTHPGIGVPGILGAILLILAFFSMQTLPTNYAGVALIFLSLLLFVAEASAPGLGLLSLGGVVSMILGSLLLFDSVDPIMRVSLVLIMLISLMTAAFSIFIVRLVLRAQKRRITTGEEGLIGTVGTARGSIKAGQEGKVFVHGEIWNAVSADDLIKGEKIKVKQVDGMTLLVEKFSKED